MSQTRTPVSPLPQPHSPLPNLPEDLREKKTPNSEIRTLKGSEQFVEFHTKHQFGSQHDPSRREHNGKQLNRKKTKKKKEIQQSISDKFVSTSPRNNRRALGYARPDRRQTQTE